MTRVLSVVARDVTPKAETVAERVRRLQNEARQAARDHVKAFAAAMVDLEQFAAEIADGGEAYPAGVRDLARRLAEDLETRVQSVEAINARAER